VRAENARRCKTEPNPKQAGQEGQKGLTQPHHHAKLNTFVQASHAIFHMGSVGVECLSASPVLTNPLSEPTAGSLRCPTSREPCSTTETKRPSRWCAHAARTAQLRKLGPLERAAPCC